MKKRSLSILLVLVMIIAMLPAAALAAEGELTRAELAELVYNKFRPEIEGEGPSFNDIGDCTPEQQTAIKALAAAGILSGSSDGTFDPHGVATRGMSAIIIWRMCGNGSADAQEIFNDVAETPYAMAVNFLVAKGALLPSDAIEGAFRPNDVATVEAVSTWLSRLIVEGEDDNNTGDDNTGEDNTEAAEGELTRAELAELVYNKFLPEPEGEAPSFSDIGDCTPEQQTAIKALAAAGILSGSGDGTFDPHGSATRGMSAIIIWRMCGNGSADAQEIFNDVAETPYAMAVNFLAAKGALLASDAIDGGFKPNDVATAEAVSTWLSRLTVEGEDDNNTGDDNTGDNDTDNDNTGDDNTGDDNTGGKVYQASDWAQAEVARADELGLIPDSLKGQDLTKEITRAEFAAIAVKVYEDLSGTAALPAVINPFTDTNDIEVLKAYNVGITNGTGDGTIFEPDDILNREQLSTMLTRVFKRVTMPGWTLGTDSHFDLFYEMPAPFADDADISDWARDSVYFMAANGIVNGVGNNTFAPKNVTTQQEATGYANATREMALLIAVRMVENLG